MFSCTEVRKKNYPDYSSPSAEYWNPNNPEVGSFWVYEIQMVKLRLRVLNDTMSEMFEYLRDNGQIGILDGSNTSHWIREYITKQIEKEVRLKLLSSPAQCPRSPVDRNAHERQLHSDASFPAREALLHRVHGIRS